MICRKCRVGAVHGARARALVEHQLYDEADEAWRSIYDKHRQREVMAHEECKGGCDCQHRTGR